MSARSLPYRSLAGVALTLGLASAALVVAPHGVNFGSLPAFRPHGPDWTLFADLAPAIQVHIAAALAAFVLGLVQLAGVKGGAAHRIVGWAWVLVMLTAAISSLFIRQLNHGMFSLIHILTGLTLVGLPMAVYAGRKGRIAAHRSGMTSLFLGGVLLAGALAFLPGRVMWELLLG